MSPHWRTIDPGRRRTGWRVFAERLGAAEGTVVEHEGTALRVTISLGIAELKIQTADARQWIERADAALYACKHGGRNRYTLQGG